MLYMLTQKANPFIVFTPVPIPSQKPNAACIVFLKILKFAHWNIERNKIRDTAVYEQMGGGITSTAR